MPPKKSSNRDVEEKTFGMKNKNKSAKVGKYIQGLETQKKHELSLKNKGNPDSKEMRERKRQAETDKASQMAELFKTIQANQKVPFGTDPKTLLCQFFKAGHCQKGTKCKFSHDLNVGRKAVKIDLYEDSRKQKEEDTMDSWDQSKLESVINAKGRENQNVPTEIVCKYFVEAIETSKYGWFWVCPNERGIDLVLGILRRLQKSDLKNAGVIHILTIAHIRDWALWEDILFSKRHPRVVSDFVARPNPSNRAIQTRYCHSLFSLPSFFSSFPFPSLSSLSGGVDLLSRKRIKSPGRSLQLHKTGKVLLGF